MHLTKVKNGTPAGNRHLCRSCSWGHIIAGYRDSELIVLCNYLTPNMKVPFTVYECTEYSDRGRPNWEQMEKLAIDVAPSRVSSKTAGFGVRKPVTPVRAPKDDEEEQDEEAAKTGLVN